MDALFLHEYPVKITYKNLTKSKSMTKCHTLSVTMRGGGDDVPFFSVKLQDGYLCLWALAGEAHAVDQLPTLVVGVGIWDADGHTHVGVKVLSRAQFEAQGVALQALY